MIRILVYDDDSKTLQFLEGGEWRDVPRIQWRDSEYADPHPDHCLCDRCAVRKGMVL